MPVPVIFYEKCDRAILLLKKPELRTDVCRSGFFLYAGGSKTFSEVPPYIRELLRICGNFQI